MPKSKSKRKSHLSGPDLIRALIEETKSKRFGNQHQNKSTTVKFNNRQINLLEDLLTVSKRNLYLERNFEKVSAELKEIRRKLNDASAMLADQQVGRAEERMRAALRHLGVDPATLRDRTATQRLRDFESVEKIIEDLRSPTAKTFSSDGTRIMRIYQLLPDSVRRDVMLYPKLINSVDFLIDHKKRPREVLSKLLRIFAERYGLRVPTLREQLRVAKKSRDRIR